MVKGNLNKYGQEYKYFLDWGEPVCVRESLDFHYKPLLKAPDILNMSYSPDDGQAELIELVDDYLLNTTKRTYQHIIITSGATPAINTVLRTFKKFDNAQSISTYGSYFPFYPEIIEKNGLEHTKGHSNVENRTDGQFKLIDMPSNVTGNMSQSFFGHQDAIWDSVYYNPVFVNSPTLNLKPHRVNIGSFSKVFGLTGLRIGYIATNSETDYKRFLSEHLHESCTVSVPSQNFITDILENVDQNMFFKHANAKVNFNRESFNKIKHLFDGQEVQNNGMFYAAYADSSALNIIDKALVKYVTLSEGDSGRKFIRFNLGQNNLLTEKAVKAILQADGGKS